MDNEILKYRQRLKERAAQKPIWERRALRLRKLPNIQVLGERN